MFVFDESYVRSLELLKKNIMIAHILIAPTWESSFELMFVGSDIPVGVILEQGRDKLFHYIYYTKKTLDSTQEYYTMTKKGMFSLVITFNKFRSYLVA